MRYGIPYQGSKNRIARKLIDFLPPADTFVDVFGGGAAMTHAALLSGKYKRVIYNELDTVAFQGVVMAFNGGFRDDNRWIPREEFHRLKDVDPYVRYCFSFGNDGKSYAYSVELEPYKRAVHYAVVFDRWEEYFRLCPDTAQAARDALEGVVGLRDRRIRFGHTVLNIVRDRKANPLYRAGDSDQLIPTLGSLENLQSVGDNPFYAGEVRQGWGQALETLQRLEALQSLPSAPNVEFRRDDYRALVIPEGDTLVYCDPPYAGKKGYSVDFDNSAFRGWVRSLPFEKVFLSEYSMPTGFREVYATERQESKAAKTSRVVQERLFVPVPLRRRLLRRRRPKK